MNAQFPRQFASVPDAVTDPPLSPQEALLDVVNAWAGSLTHSQRVQLSESITRITAERPVWPIGRATPAVIAEREGRN